jgi:hypothetical protein
LRRVQELECATAEVDRASDIKPAGLAANFGCELGAGTKDQRSSYLQRPGTAVGGSNTASRSGDSSHFSLAGQDTADERNAAGRLEGPHDELTGRNGR